MVFPLNQPSALKKGITWKDIETDRKVCKRQKVTEITEHRVLWQFGSFNKKTP